MSAYIKFLFNYRKHRLLLITTVIGFLGLTNHWNLDNSKISIYRLDAVSYYEIAKVSPQIRSEYNLSKGYPNLADAAHSKIPHHHAQRFVFPWLIGYFSNLLKIDPIYLFSIATIAVSFAICYVLLNLLNFPIWLFLIIVCNPYFFRFYFCVTPYINDLIFQLGLVLVVYFLKHKNDSKLRVLISTLLATLSRQTGLLILPGVFKNFIKTNQTSHWIVFILMANFVIYKFTGFVAQRINPHSDNFNHVIGLFQWIHKAIQNPNYTLPQEVPLFPFHFLIGIPLAVKDIIGLLFRASIPLAPPLTIFLICLRVDRKKVKDSINENFDILLIGFAVLSQPFLAGPLITGATIPRLVTLSVIPFFYVLKKMTEDVNIQNQKLLIFTCVLVSFHHEYTWVGTMLSHSNTVFLVTSLLGIVGIVGLFISRMNTASAISNNLN